MVRFRLRLISFISIVVNNLIPNRLLFSKKKADEIYFAYINPDEITRTSFISEGSGNLNGERAKFGIRGGLWNFLHYDFNENVMARFSKEIIQDKEGDVYKYIASGHSTAEAEKIKRKLQDLYKQLKEKGYLSQYEMKRLQRTTSLGAYDLPKNEIFVAINKKGEFIRLFSGRHRLALCQILKIKEVPVIITLMDPKAKRFLPKKNRKITGMKEDYRPFC